MQRLILSLIVISICCAAYAQKVNIYGQKIVKEIYVADMDRKGTEIPRERYCYTYDDSGRLIGVTKHEYQRNEYEDGIPPTWFVSDSIYIKSGKLNRQSFYYDRHQHGRVQTKYTYTYTLNPDRTISKVEALLHPGDGSISKFNYNFYYDKVPETNRTRLIKYDWDEWWLPEGKHKWNRQCWPNIRMIDYGSGVWANRVVDKTPDEKIASRQKLIDFNMPDDLNIDISGILNKSSFHPNPDFHCEGMTEWIPRRLDFFPIDEIGLFKSQPFVYERDANGNIIEIKGYWKTAKDNNIRQDLLVRIKYL